jgi:fido (protein-threonine AMPylation protein)
MKMDAYSTTNYTRVQESTDAVLKQGLWDAAIGLQAVDGLEPSPGLLELASASIASKLTYEQVKAEIELSYSHKDLQDSAVHDAYECDLVSARMVEMLDMQPFTYTYHAFRQIHKKLFDGVFEDAGRYRDYDIEKSEPVLFGDTVTYASFPYIEDRYRDDLEVERGAQYSYPPTPEQVRRIADLTSRLWVTHGFGEGNTRTTAVFIQMYLRSMKMPVNNEPFKEHSLYFRNALVRANYSNLFKGVASTNKYIIAFFENVLASGTNTLSNRDLIVKELE